LNPDRPEDLSEIGPEFLIKTPFYTSLNIQNPRVGVNQDNNVQKKPANQGHKKSVNPGTQQQNNDKLKNSKMSSAYVEGASYHLDLDFPVKRVKMAAAGKYFVVQSMSKSTLQLFDYEKHRLSKILDFGDDKVFFATGADRLVIYSVAKDIFFIYQIPEMDLISEFQSQIPFQILNIGMGNLEGTECLVLCQNERHPKLMKITLVSHRVQELTPNLPTSPSLREYNSNRFHNSWDQINYRIGSNAIQLQGNHYDISEQVEEHNHRCINGLLFSRHGFEAGYSSNDSIIVNRTNSTDLAIPDPYGQILLNYNSNASSVTNDISLYSVRHKLELPIFIGLQSNRLVDIDLYHSSFYGLEKSTFFLPHYDSVVMVLEKAINITILNLDKNLKKHNEWDLIPIFTHPYHMVPRRTALHVQLPNPFRKGKVTYELLYGPKGIKLSKSGDLRWRNRLSERCLKEVLVKIHHKNVPDNYYRFYIFSQ
jgi:hypothetical protein